ncbi:MAG: prolyl oligopeptidase family serine peptidase [Chitinophagaceae bacterium]|nr:prolyl oligopeptidase family serine peptidase [Chitinophagaceae bacterium]
MNNKIYLLLCFLLLTLTAHSQDGKIVSQTPYTIADSSIKKWIKNIPDLNAIINSIDFFSITYLSDGLKVKGYLAVPKKAGKYPAIIYNRGGNREFGALTDGQLIRFLALTAGWGYVCIASQYRGNGGSEGKEEFGGKDVNDILNLIPCLSAIDKADTSRIGMWGWSRGGMMTYLALTKTNKIKAAIVGSGMADGFIQTKKRPEMDSVFMELAPGYLQNKDSVLKTRSAVYWADRICMTTPLLLLTGSADWRVSPEEQLEMVNKLYEIKHPLRFEFFEGGQHSLIEHFDEVNQAVKNFLDKYVRDGQPIPSLQPHGK